MSSYPLRFSVSSILFDGCCGLLLVAEDRNEIEACCHRSKIDISGVVAVVVNIYIFGVHMKSILLSVPVRQPVSQMHVSSQTETTCSKQNLELGGNTLNITQFLISKIMGIISKWPISIHFSLLSVCDPNSPNIIIAHFKGNLYIGCSVARGGGWVLQED